MWRGQWCVVAENQWDGFRVGDEVIRDGAMGICRRFIVTGFSPSQRWVCVASVNAWDFGEGAARKFVACLFPEDLRHAAGAPATTHAVSGNQLDLFGATA